MYMFHRSATQLFCDGDWSVFLTLHKELCKRSTQTTDQLRSQMVWLSNTAVFRKVQGIVLLHKTWKIFPFLIEIETLSVCIGLRCTDSMTTTN